MTNRRWIILLKILRGILLAALVGPEAESNYAHLAVKLIDDELQEETSN